MLLLRPKFLLPYIHFMMKIHTFFYVRINRCKQCYQKNTTDFKDLIQILVLVCLMIKYLLNWSYKGLQICRLLTSNFLTEVGFRVNFWSKLNIMMKIHTQVAVIFHSTWTKIIVYFNTCKSSASWETVL